MEKKIIKRRLSPWEATRINRPTGSYVWLRFDGWRTYGTIGEKFYSVFLTEDTSGEPYLRLFHPDSPVEEDFQ